jgi:hypothetical protein
MIAAQIHGNYLLLKTWTGKCDFVDRFCFPGNMPGTAVRDQGNTAGFCETTAGSLEFQWDLSSDRLHVFYHPARPLEHSDILSGKSSKQDYAGDTYHWIITPEHWIEFGTNVELGQIKEFPNVPSVPSQGGRIVKRKVRKEADRSGRIFEPIDLFSNGTMPFWQHCQFYADALTGKRSADEKQHVEKNAHLLKRSGSPTCFVLTIDYPGPGIDAKHMGRAETVFDSSVGFQPTSWIRFVGDHVVEKRAISYKNIAGTFIPASFLYEIYDTDHPETKVPKLSRALTFKSSTLNDPIPASRFGIEQFDLKYGERMMDEIENRLYVQDKTGLVPADQFKIDPDKIPTVFTGQATGHSRNWPLISLNVVVVIVLASIVLLRRGWAKQQ